MAGGKDLGIEQVARDNPGTIYRDGDTGVVVRTSTCEVERFPLVSKPSDVTADIHQCIYDYCIDSTGRPRKNVIKDAAKLFERTERQIENILKELFPRST